MKNLNVHQSLRVALIFVLVVLFTGCQSDKSDDDKTGEILPKSEMVKILADVHLAEAASDLRGREFVDGEVLFSHYEAMILQKHQIDTATYLRSLRHYFRDPKQAQQLYEVVYQTLEVMRPASQPSPTMPKR
ncbi:MAG: DUF4296 domain-containing protein [Bacteroidota bacterium]